MTGTGVTPYEVIALAAVLEVPPIELIFPIGYQDLIEIMPGITVPSRVAAAWFTGKLSAQTAA